MLNVECFFTKLFFSDQFEVYRKIITPVETRWGSQYAMVKSILDMRYALSRIRDAPHKDDPIAREIPTDEDMDLLMELEPMLAKINETRCVSQTSNCIVMYR